MIETDPQEIQILELAINFKRTVINIFKNIDDKMVNFIR